MQACVDWVLIIFGTQVIKKKRPVRPVFPDYPFLMTMFKPNRKDNGMKSADIVLVCLLLTFNTLSTFIKCYYVLLIGYYKI